MFNEKFTSTSNGEAKLAVMDKPGMTDVMCKLYARLRDIECKVDRLDTVLFGTSSSSNTEPGDANCLREHMYMTLERAEVIDSTLSSILENLGCGI